MTPELNKIYCGDALNIMRTWPSSFVNCVITSPPYWGLRDYGSCSCGSGRFDLGQGEGTGGNMNYRPAKGFNPDCQHCRGMGRIIGTETQIGLEKTLDEYVAKMVDVFREVRRVLRDDCTLWLNLGDSYAGSMKGSGCMGEWSAKQNSNRGSNFTKNKPMLKIKTPGLKPKDLCGIPWQVALALRNDGWYLRQDIIWAKPNPMPESVIDRCTKSHEYIFLLTKSRKYFYDADAISQPASAASIKQLSQPTLSQQAGSDRVPGKTNGPMKAVFGGRNKHAGFGTRIHSGREDEGNYIKNGVNKRSVWTITTKPYRQAHFATFPKDIPEICIKAGSPIDGIVLDPFAGAGTTCLVAKKLGRQYLGIDLNPEYVKMAEARIEKECPNMPMAVNQ